MLLFNVCQYMHCYAIIKPKHTFINNKDCETVPATKRGFPTSIKKCISDTSL